MMLIKTKHLLLYLTAFAFFPAISSLRAQQNVESEKEIKLNQSYFTSYLDDSKDILKSPFQLNKTQYLKTAALAASAITLMYFGDKPVKDFFKNNRNKFADNIFKYGAEHWGDGLYSMPLTGGLYLIGKSKGNNKAINTSLIAAKTFFITALMINIPKEFFHRKRPYETDQTFYFLGPLRGYGTDKNRSFPSGHSMSAFAMATIFASAYNENKAVVYTAYSLATLTAISRVYFERHWTSDVLIGSAFGYAMAQIIYRKNSWIINPIYSKNYNGIKIQIPLN